ncbi:MAG: hypothetical protein Q9162_003967 [Coniocarpon cinnabarinum]
MATKPHQLTISMLLFLLLSSIGIASARRYTKDKDAVRLADINALTFHKDRQTTHRRVASLPQLTCTGGSGCKYYEADSVRCVNSGSSYDASSIEWTCKASLPPEFKLGSTEVVCEGFDNADDEFVLKGSCALEYRLLLTDLGAEKFGSGGSSFNLGGLGQGMDSGALLSAGIFWVFFAGIAGWILYSLWKAVFRPDPDRRNRRPNDGRGWGGGWGGDDDDDPPPPYSPYRDSASSARSQKPRASKSSQAGSSRASSSRGAGAQQQRPWWQYFGAGTAAGAAAAYMAGNSRNTQRERERVERERMMGGGGSWFGGGPSTQTWGSNSPRNPVRSSSGGFGSSSPSVSESRYESTGFGGTRRR